MKKEFFVEMALKYLDYPAVKYRDFNLGKTIVGFDCSGYVNFLLNECRYPGPIPRHCNEFFDSFGICIHDQFRREGDLVFFSFKSGGLYPDHMGILISKDQYVHSPGKDGKVVCIDNLETKKIPDNKPDQIYAINPIGIKRITVLNGRYQQMFLT